jgi:hypothetical protein
MHNDIAERVHDARVALCYNCNNSAFDYVECNQINVIRDGCASEVIQTELMVRSICGG